MEEQLATGTQSMQWHWIKRNHQAVNFFAVILLNNNTVSCNFCVEFLNRDVMQNKLYPPLSSDGYSETVH